YIYLQLAVYLTSIVPQLAGYQFAVAVFTTVALAASHWRSVHRAGTIQEFTTLLKGLAFLALVAAFFALGEPRGVTEPSALPLPTGWLFLGASVLAFQAILQTYDGWEGAIYFGEEVREPGRNLPRSLI